MQTTLYQGQVRPRPHGGQWLAGRLRNTDRR